VSRELIRPIGRIRAYDPLETGYIVEQGYSMQWRFKRGSKVDHPDLGVQVSSEKGDREYGPWTLDGCEIIDEIGALAPAANMRSVQDMNNIAWTFDPPLDSTTPKWRLTRVSGNPSHIAAQFTDGSFHAAGTQQAAKGTIRKKASWYGDFKNGFLLRLDRHSPPPDEISSSGVITPHIDSMTIVIMSGRRRYEEEGPWVTGYLTLLLPASSATFRSPCLHWFDGEPSEIDIDDAAFNLLATGKRSTTEQQGFGRTTWLVEFIDGPVYNGLGFLESMGHTGLHVLIRTSLDDEDRWYSHLGDIHVDGDVFNISCQGCVQHVSVSELSYPSTATAWAMEPRFAPGYMGDVQNLRWRMPAKWAWDSWETWNDGETGTITIDLVPQEKENWFDEEFNPGVFWPRVRFTGVPNDDRSRGILWGLRAIIPPLTDIVSPRNPGTTDDQGVLESLSYSVNSEWRGAGGTATIIASASNLAIHNWKRGSFVEIYLGWDGEDLGLYSMGLASFACGYIMDIRFGATGDDPNRISAEIEIGDFVKARMGKSMLIDSCQSGGRFICNRINFNERVITGWFPDMMARCGLFCDTDHDSSTCAVLNGVVAIDPYFLDLSIDLDPEMPSRMWLECNDGTAIQSHLDEVVNGMGFVDEDAYSSGPRWGFGQIGQAFLDKGRPRYDDSIPVAFVVDTTSANDLSGDGVTQNMITTIQRVTDTEKFRNAFKTTYRGRDSYAADPAAARLAEGGDLWHFSTLGNSRAVARENLMERRRRSVTVEMTTPMAPWLQPDMFVRIDSGALIGIPVGSVFQVTSHQITMSGMDATSTVGLVHLQDEEAP